MNLDKLKESVSRGLETYLTYGGYKFSIHPEYKLDGADGPAIIQAIAAGVTVCLVVEWNGGVDPCFDKVDYKTVQVLVQLDRNNSRLVLQIVEDSCYSCVHGLLK